VLLLPQAAADVEIKAQHSIQLRDVQQLVLWVLGDAVAPRWVFTKVRQQQQQQQQLPHQATATADTATAAAAAATAAQATT
jgi:hypothetical protein